MATLGDPEIYAALHRGQPGDVPFYVAQCRGASSVLELGCGFGRVLEHLRAPGRTLVGVDRSEAMLRLARARLGSTAQLRRADMTRLRLDRTFDRVLLPHTGLYCLPSRDDLLGCLRGVAEHLNAGGRFVLDAWAADAFAESAEVAGEDEPVTVDPVEIDGVRYEVTERSRFDPKAQRVDVEYTLRPAAGGAARRSRVSHHYWTAAQLVGALEEVGLRLRTLDGGFRGELYDDDAELMVVVAER